MFSARKWLLSIARSATVGLGLAVVACSVNEYGQIVFDPLEPSGNGSWDSKTSQPNADSKYHSSVHFIRVDEKALDSLTQSNSRIEIDLGEQRARVFRTASSRSKERLVIETQISTGREGYSTPSGSFRILEKSRDKKSNLYGKWVDANTGKTLISDGDIRKPPKEGNADFQGAPMPYWMRITSGGVGMHIGYVPNHPASHGCIRVPKQVQPLIYSKIRVGTPVKIVH